MKQKDYAHKLNTFAVNQANASSSTSTEKALPSGQSLYDSLENLFYIEHEVKHLFTSQPNFAKYTNADEVYRKMIRMKIPDNVWWTNLTDLL